MATVQLHDTRVGRLGNIHTDVFSVQIPADLPDKLATVSITCGGSPLLTFTVEMLKRLPVEEGKIEILQPFMSHLPVSQLIYSHVCVQYTFVGPTVEVTFRTCPPRPYADHPYVRPGVEPSAPDREFLDVIPFYQPFETAAQTEAHPAPAWLLADARPPPLCNVFTAPNELAILVGMGAKIHNYEPRPSIGM